MPRTMSHLVRASDPERGDAHALAKPLQFALVFLRVLDGDDAREVGPVDAEAGVGVDLQDDVEGAGVEDVGHVRVGVLLHRRPWFVSGVEFDSAGDAERLVSARNFRGGQRLLV